MSLQFAAVYTKRHLINNLIIKIRLLQLLLQNKFFDQRNLLKEYERLSKSTATPDVLKYLGISPSGDEENIATMHTSKEMRLVKQNGRNQSTTVHSEANSVSNKNPSKEERDVRPAIGNSTLVLSSRVKPLEELPVPDRVTNPTKSKKEICPNDKYIHNDLLSPYSDQTLTCVKQRNSPSRLKAGCSSLPVGTNERKPNRDSSSGRLPKDTKYET